MQLLVRQSIPVFFQGEEFEPAKLTWELVERDGKVLLVANNAGDRHLRIASLVLRDAAGRTIDFGDGLLGYVLGRSTMSWELPPGSGRFGRKGAVKVSGRSELGAITGVAVWHAAR